MSLDFGSARRWARELQADAIKDARVCVDATMGNGHDMLWMCENIPENCKIYGFDVQEAAVESTRARLNAAGFADCAELICAGHERMDEFVNEKIGLCVFNLGWLPGGDHNVTTRVNTTLIAIDKAAHMLDAGGILTICVYPGHDEGTREKDAVLGWARALDSRVFDVFSKEYLNQPNCPPLLIAVRRRP